MYNAADGMANQTGGNAGSFALALHCRNPRGTYNCPFTWCSCMDVTLTSGDWLCAEGEHWLSRYDMACQQRCIQVIIVTFGRR